ncbi:N(G),N(G)-dimethylarginine dimethylaminohydrolase 1 [Seminavis robusta]|uniref:N(G),N(G)-dimethylarginine dimethylaminohydrolase 1 n=1 Tax=Seminavis robusta TaxID=568900 RepID=A0A9N8H769_9STRA|nr:N(G),N(G)-dimethylarginine dimethylaminohydrolase 1 [Seminavis robusta]|eukprot:Sro194_g082930.1 N(G),N(G)-dimethylarginine dimethylaminohydrolase 1 (320) ;mRNA; r:66108-67067
MATTLRRLLMRPGTLRPTVSLLPHFSFSEASSFLLLSKKSSLSRRSLYNFAVTRQIPNSFVNSISKYYENNNQDDAAISISLAKSQHEDYVKLLRLKVPTLELPPLEHHPDCVFVEDTVVAVDNRAVITWPGHASRQGEVDSIRQVLEQLGMDVWEMKTQNADAICDGGDVMYTGRHLFVGLSERTNAQGASVLEEAFSPLPMVTVALDAKDALHLKSIVTHMDEYTILAPQGSLGDKVLQAMDAAALGYTTVRLPDIRACNVVTVNGLIVASDNICEESRAILLDCALERNLDVEFVGNTEIAKSDGANTCCSVLLSL